MAGRPVKLYDNNQTNGDVPGYQPTFMYEEDSPVMLYDAAKHKPPEEPNNNNSKSEYSKTVEVSKAPDTFPCGHVLCHHCLRRHMSRKYTSLRCPICFTRVDVGMTPPSPLSPLSPMSPMTPTSPSSSVSTAVAYDSEQEANISLLSNFGEIVKKFNGVNYNLRHLKHESVQSRSLGMTYTSTMCDLCGEDHGTLKVIQELSNLTLNHERPSRMMSYFYRLAEGHMLTTFYTKVNTACICVPCSYKELRETHQFPELQYISDHDTVAKPQSCLAEVGKLIARDAAPVMALKGKNVIEVDHTIKVRERADQFDFNYTANLVERMVKQQERDLVNMATKQIRDTGGLYHIQESNEVEMNVDETIV